MLKPLVSRTSKYKVRLTQLIDARKTLESGVVDNINFFWIKPNKAINRKKEFLTVRFSIGKRIVRRIVRRIRRIVR